MAIITTISFSVISSNVITNVINQNLAQDTSFDIDNGIIYFILNIDFIILFWLTAIHRNILSEDSEISDEQQTSIPHKNKQDLNAKVIEGIK